VATTHVAKDSIEQLLAVPMRDRPGQSPFLYSRMRFSTSVQILGRGKSHSNQKSLENVDVHAYLATQPEETLSPTEPLLIFLKLENSAEHVPDVIQEALVKTNFG
jgi:hypothetical protein